MAGKCRDEWGGVGTSHGAATYSNGKERGLASWLRQAEGVLAMACLRGCFAHVFSRHRATRLSVSREGHYTPGYSFECCRASVFCLAQEKIKRGAPPGWELELVRLSMGREAPALSNWQVGGRGGGRAGEGHYRGSKRALAGWDGARPEQLAGGKERGRMGVGGWGRMTLGASHPSVGLGR